MEIFKRSEFNSFLTETLRTRKLKLYNLQFEKSFTIYFKGEKKPKKIEDICHGIYMGGKIQSAFKAS